MGALLVLACLCLIGVIAGRALWRATDRLKPPLDPPDPTSPSRPATAGAHRPQRPKATRPSPLPPDFADALDLRQLSAGRHRVKGTFAYVPAGRRRDVGGIEYWLVREPSNPHDSNAVAVWDTTRKVGYISAAKASLLAPELDRVNAPAFRVNGESSADKIALHVHLPHIKGVRALQINSSTKGDTE
ncbi:HIRAN domain-containing protein [Curtobacterium sp. BH-2-1-1]|uniref:HIRAN domain-containing protein n=1 Tax=Curtobacterium sp. BH-2-1-1 TaxID=1905847 RepID=UPI0012EA3170